MIVDLAIYDDLNENFASMPGSRHKNGGPLIFLNYSCIDKKNNKIHKVLQYFISITTDITSKYGFWVIIDMRKMDSHFLKYIVSEINTLKKNVHKIYIIKSNSFWSIKSLISSSFKTDIETAIVSLDELYDHICKENLISEYDGSFMYNQSDWIKQRMNFESIISKLNEILDFCNTFQIEYDQSKIASDSSSIDKILLNIRNGNDTCKKYKEKYIQINQNLKNIYSSTLNSNVDIADAKSDTDELMEICQRKLNSKFSNFDESIQNLNQQKVVIVMIEKIEHYIGVIKSHVQVVSRSFLKIGENIEKCKEFRNMNTENNVRINKLLEICANLIYDAKEIYDLHKTIAKETRLCQTIKFLDTTSCNLLRLTDNREELLDFSIIYHEKCQQIEEYSQFINQDLLPKELIDQIFNEISNGKYCDKFDCLNLLSSTQKYHEKHLTTIKKMSSEFFKSCESLTTYIENLRNQNDDICNLISRDEFDAMDKFLKIKRGEIEAKICNYNKRIRDNAKDILPISNVIIFLRDTETVIQWLNNHCRIRLKDSTRIGMSLEQVESLISKNSEEEFQVSKVLSNAHKLLSTIEPLSSNFSRICYVLEETRAVIETSIKTCNLLMKKRTEILNLGQNYYRHCNEIIDWLSDFIKGNGEDDSFTNFILKDAHVQDCKKLINDIKNQQISIHSAISRISNESVTLLNNIQQGNNVQMDALFERDEINAINEKLSLVEDIYAEVKILWNKKIVELEFAVNLINFKFQIKNLYNDVKIFFDILNHLIEQNNNFHNILDIIKFCDQKNFTKYCCGDFLENHFKKIQTESKQLTNNCKILDENFNRIDKNVNLKFWLDKNVVIYLNKYSNYENYRNDVNFGIFYSTCNVEEGEIVGFIGMHGTLKKINSVAIIMYNIVVNVLIGWNKLRHVELEKEYMISETEKTTKKLFYEFGSIYEKSLCFNNIENCEIFRARLLNLQNLDMKCDLFSSNVLLNHLDGKINDLVLDITSYQHRYFVNEVICKCLINDLKLCYNECSDELNVLRRFISSSISWSKTTDNLNNLIGNIKQESYFIESLFSEEPSNHADFEKRQEIVKDLIHKHMDEKIKFLKAFTLTRKVTDSMIKYTNELKIKLEIKFKSFNVKKMDLFMLIFKTVEFVKDYLKLLMGHEETFHIDWLTNLKKLESTKLVSSLQHLVNKISQNYQSSKNSVVKELDYLKKFSNSVNIIKSHYETANCLILKIENLLLNESKKKDMLGQLEYSIDEMRIDGSSESLSSDSFNLIKKRLNITNEIIKTEECFVENLKIFMTHYLKSPTLFGKKCTDSKWTSNSDYINPILADVTNIYTFHKDIFLKELKLYEKHPESIGHCFITWGDHMVTLYAHYTVSHPKFTHVLEKFPEYNYFCNAIARTNNIETIGSILISPIQRMTKFSLLMSDLKKTWLPDNVPLDLENGLKATKNVPSRSNWYLELHSVNEGISQNALKSLGIPRLYYEFTVLPVKSKSFKKFISKNDELNKSVTSINSSFLKNKKVKCIFLFDTHLIITKTINKKCHLTKSNQKILKNFVRIDQLGICDFAENVSDDRTFSILYKSGSQKVRLSLMAEIVDVKREWVFCIRSLSTARLSRVDISEKANHRKDSENTNKSIVCDSSVSSTSSKNDSSKANNSKSFGYNKAYHLKVKSTIQLDEICIEKETKLISIDQTYHCTNTTVTCVVPSCGYKEMKIPKNKLELIEVDEYNNK